MRRFSIALWESHALCARAGRGQFIGHPAGAREMDMGQGSNSVVIDDLRVVARPFLCTEANARPSMPIAGELSCSAHATMRSRSIAAARLGTISALYKEQLERTLFRSNLLIAHQRKSSMRASR